MSPRYSQGTTHTYHKYNKHVYKSTPTLTSRRSVLILSFHIRLGLPSGFLPSGFLTKTLYAPLLSVSVGLLWCLIATKLLMLMLDCLILKLI